MKSYKSRLQGPDEFSAAPVVRSFTKWWQTGFPRVKEGAKLFLALAFTMLLQGCLQDNALEPDKAIVMGEIQAVLTEGSEQIITRPGGRANIRVDISNTAPARTNASRDLLLTDAGFTDEFGEFVVPTANRGDNFFAVARHPEYLPEVGPLLPLSIGQTTVLTNFLRSADPVTGELSPEFDAPTMVSKPPGRAKFIFVRSESAFEKLVSVEVMGDFNGFSKTDGLLLLFDDGNDNTQDDDDGTEFFSGDGVLGDGILTRIVDGLPPGRLRYNFLINSNLVIRDLFEESSEEMVDENNLRVTRSVMIIK